MELLKLDIKKIILTLVIINFYSTSMAQTKGVIIDIETLSPIPFVSIHTKGLNVRGTIGNEYGEYSINFKYDTVYFSHINYELLPLTKHSKCDTIFMTPIVHIMPDVVITVQNNKWIEKLLKQFVKEKSKNYHTEDQILNYSFDIKSLSDSSGYAFSSNGYLISPEYSKKEGYLICPITNLIKYKDKTAGKDFMQLRRSLYNNFIKDFDYGFIKKHIFSLTEYNCTLNKNLLKFSFKSKKGEENEGYIIIDTLKNVIIEFEQVSGTNYNINSNTSSLARFVGEKKGFRYTVWKTLIRGKYSLFDNSYHLAECRYQLFRQNEYKRGKGLFFTNIESVLNISRLKMKSDILKDYVWLKLPNPYSISIIVSKETRLAEEALERTPAKYELF